MANYNAVCKTNLFRVTDEERYREIFMHLISGDNIDDLSQTINGVLMHGFGAYDSIDWVDEDGYGDMDTFYEELQKILPEGESFIYTEIGNEKLRYVAAYSVICTKNTFCVINLEDMASEKAAELLGSY